MSGVEDYLTQWVQKNGPADVFVYLGCGVVPSNSACFSYARTALLIDANMAFQEVNEAVVADQPGASFIAQLVGTSNAQVSYNVYNFPRLNSTQPEKDLLKRYPNAKLLQSNLCDSVSLLSLLEKHTDLAASERILMWVDINGGEQSLLESLPDSFLQKIKMFALKLAPENAYENAWGLDDARAYMESRRFSVYRYGNTAAYGPCELLFTFNDASSQPSQELKQAFSEEVAINAALHAELELSRSISQDLHLDVEILTRQVESLESLRDTAKAELERTVANYEAQIGQLASQIESLQAHCDALESNLKDVRENSARSASEATVFQSGALQRIDDRDHATQSQLLRAQTQIDLLKDLLVGRDKE